MLCGIGRYRMLQLHAVACALRKRILDGAIGPSRKPGVVSVPDAYTLVRPGVDEPFRSTISLCIEDGRALVKRGEAQLHADVALQRKRRRRYRDAVCVRAEEDLRMRLGEHSRELVYEGEVLRRTEGGIVRLDDHTVFADERSHALLALAHHSVVGKRHVQVIHLDLAGRRSVECVRQIVRQVGIVLVQHIVGREAQHSAVHSALAVEEREPFRMLPEVALRRNVALHLVPRTVPEKGGRKLCRTFSVHVLSVARGPQLVPVVQTPARPAVPLPFAHSGARHVDEVRIGKRKVGGARKHNAELRGWARPNDVGVALKQGIGAVERPLHRTAEHEHALDSVLVCGAHREPVGHTHLPDVLGEASFRETFADIHGGDILFRGGRLLHRNICAGHRAHPLLQLFGGKRLCHVSTFRHDNLRRHLAILHKLHGRRRTCKGRQHPAHRNGPFSAVRMSASRHCRRCGF